MTAINVPDLSPADDAFTHLQTQHPLDWIRLTGQPSNGVERRTKGVRVSRYRAAAQAAWHAKSGRFVISHLPLMTAAVAHLLRLRGNPAAHLGFAFNFAQLPVGVRFKYLKHAFENVDQMAVFSAYEERLYAEYFDIDPARFRRVIWTQQVPPVQKAVEIGVQGPYLCAIGGEGRDFQLLLEVARRLGPTVPLVIIARPHSLAGLVVPENVMALSNIPLAQVWGIAYGSRGVLVPLLQRNTCCGHITLVSAKLLGLPVATTYADATREYVKGRRAVLECEPGDATVYTDLARRLLEDKDDLHEAAHAAIAQELEFHDRRIWAQYLDRFIEERILC
ncbi:MAG: hypothetical protein BGO13_05255 [Burkholderiales bacterium 66-5]|nr:MAG: hypothetical protein BGO13_05255 [Burkholderiales bacterium 66-5]